MAHHYYPYGEEASNAMVDQERMKFTGHERDLCCDGYPNLSDNMHARQYSPLQGRFLRPDPILGNLLQPQSWNRYAYVLGSPLNFIDPFGLEEKKPGEQMNPGDTCAGTVIDGWCVGQMITVRAPSPVTSPFRSYFGIHGGGDGGGVVVGSDPVNAGELQKFGDCVGGLWHMVEDVVAPFVVGQGAMLAGSVAMGVGAITTVEGVAVFIPSFGTSSLVIAAGATTTISGAYLYGLGMTVQINQINRGLSYLPFNAKLPSPSDRFPGAFPAWPSVKNGGSHGNPCSH